MLGILMRRWLDVKEALNKNLSSGPTLRLTFCFLDFPGEDFSLTDVGEVELSNFEGES
jgi:hypothetical protein